MNFWCVGRNYADHAKELGHAVPSEPMIFLKAGSCLVEGPEIRLPAWPGEIHHELEIALQFSTSLNFAKMALALDLTDRVAQNRLKEKGQPWTLAKSFRGACPLSPAVPFRDPRALHLQLLVNGQIRQDGLGKDMIFDAATLKSFVLERFPVVPGDWLLTGTPAGVGALKPGDRLEASLSEKETRILQTEWHVVA